MHICVSAKPHSMKYGTSQLLHMGKTLCLGSERHFSTIPFLFLLSDAKRLCTGEMYTNIYMECVYVFVYT